MRQRSMGLTNRALATRSLDRRNLLKLSGSAAGGLALNSLTGGLTFNSLLDTSTLQFGPQRALAVAPGNEHFQRVWERTDMPVKAGMISRTWMWGPEAFADVMTEEYAESPGGQRAVQYFDKARMEISHPDSGDPSSIWYVTNGLLVVELVTGQMQMGDSSFVDRAAAQINVAGDVDDPNGATYATFSTLLDAAPLAVNAAITQRVDRQGNVTTDTTLGDQQVFVGFIDDVTNHSIAAPFWEFMNSSGTVYENGQYVQNNLFQDPNFATGRPISEPYWTEVLVAGTLRLVLVQCFERRCLTYTPGNPSGWLVEAGNVGLHYYSWRYGVEEPEQPEEPEEPETPEEPEEPEEPEIPEPVAGACVPMVSGHKPKKEYLQRLQPLLDNNPMPSALGGAMFQMMRRFLLGHKAASPLEVAAFEVWETLPADLLAVLKCSIDTLDSLPETDRNRLVSPDVFGIVDQPLDQGVLVNLISQELLKRTSLEAFGNADCIDEEHPGQVRLTAEGGSDDVLPALIRINRVNSLRVNSYSPSLTLADYLPQELQQQCTPETVDGEVTLNCEVQMGDWQTCPGNSIDGACLRVQEVRGGEAVMVEGVNFFSVDTKVLIEAKFPGTLTREVDAHVCGDMETPLMETVDGEERFISDSRVKDQLSFKVPEDLPVGIYTFMVLVPNTIGVPGYGDNLYSDRQFIQVMPAVTATFQVASEELHAVEETSPASFGSDEVGIRAVVIPINAGLVPGEAIEHKFPIFGDVDSGNTRDLNKVLFQGSGIEGLSITILGFEVDSEDQYEKQVEGLIDAYMEVLKSAWNILAGAIGAVGGKIALALGFAEVWAGAIALAVALIVNLFVALWAPADLIIEDAASFSLLSLAALTSVNSPTPAEAEYSSAGGIDVKVVPVSKGVQYHERREYRSDSEDSNYHITLRYNMLEA